MKKNSRTKGRRFNDSDIADSSCEESSPESESTSNEFSGEDSDRASSESEQNSEEEEHPQASSSSNTHILMPEWKTKLNIGKMTEPHDFDRINVHSHLEIIESRIIRRQMDPYVHPGQVIEAAEKCPFPIKKTLEEEDRGLRYDVIIKPTRIPQFWVPRPWDKETDRMTQEESERLASDIYVKSTEYLNASVSIDPKENTVKVIPPSNRSETLNNKKKQRRPKVVFSASKLDYLTDHYDEQTDYEW